MMKKSLFIFFALVSAILPSRGEITADWKIHMPFDEWPRQVVDTPDKVYILSRTFEDLPTLSGRDFKSHSLFYYDKKGDEIVSVNRRINSNGNAVSSIAYNSRFRYLVVAYTDCNIDLIFDNGTVKNIAALKIASIPGKKEINTISFDPENHLVYVATSFGYVTIDDTRNEIRESRNYGVNVSSVGRSGDNVVLNVDGKCYYAPVEDKRFNFSDYEQFQDFPDVVNLIFLENGNIYGYTDYPYYLYAFKPDEDNNYSCTKISDDPLYAILGYQQIYEGWLLTGNAYMFYFRESGDEMRIARPQSEWSIPVSTLNLVDLWTLTAKKGLRYFKKDGDWKLVKDYMRPNAPATYISTSATYHPTYGMLVGSNGYDLAMPNHNQNTPVNVSALKNGLWKEFGPKYTNPDRFNNPINYTGLTIDPKNNKYVYRGSVLGGIMRINLDDPSDIYILGNTSNRYSSSPGFVPIVEDMQAWNMLCQFSPPQFTDDGTMWTLFNQKNKEQGELWYWSATDRAAFNSVASYRPMKTIPVPKDFSPGNLNTMIPLNKTKNMFVMGSSANGGILMLFDHRGTPDVTSDDRSLLYANPYDQDGGGITFLGINNIVEDPQTGLVWILSQRGVFTLNPATAFDNPNRLNRIKVARNDGTNLADYLLNEINVNHMSIDGEGRKWFSTSNGLVCTSTDGRSILGEFTPENSFLPDNNVYATCYNPENNSLMVATGSGLVEMFPSGAGNSSAEGSSMRIFPNPVEPDYYGWVRIDNIADGSLVKITDAKGGIVKELGPVEGGSVEWDVSGLNNTRVSTGVYYVMVSPGSGGGKTEISKVLVLN